MKLQGNEGTTPARNAEVKQADDPALGEPAVVNKNFLVGISLVTITLEDFSAALAEQDLRRPLTQQFYF